MAEKLIKECDFCVQSKFVRPLFTGSLVKFTILIGNMDECKK